MPIGFVTGDVVVNRVIAEAFAHGCNYAGSMGATGPGGLSWKKVRTLIEVAFANRSGMLYVYGEFTADE